MASYESSATCDKYLLHARGSRLLCFSAGFKPDVWAGRRNRTRKRAHREDHQPANQDRDADRGHPQQKSEKAGPVDKRDNIVSGTWDKNSSESRINAKVVFGPAIDAEPKIVGNVCFGKHDNSRARCF